jgi:hypothetical protein
MPEDQPRTRPRSVTRAEFDKLAAALAELRTQVEADRAVRAEMDRRNDADRALRLETHGRVERMYGALMETTPGQTMSLLDRMASATIDIESGQRVAHLLIKFGAVLTALGGILGGTYLAFLFGAGPKH